jgi:hypothetical protein
MPKIITPRIYSRKTTDEFFSLFANRCNKYVRDHDLGKDEEAWIGPRVSCPAHILDFIALSATEGEFLSDPLGWIDAAIEACGKLDCAYFFMEA